MAKKPMVPKAKKSLPKLPGKAGAKLPAFLKKKAY